MAAMTGDIKIEDMVDEQVTEEDRAMEKVSDANMQVFREVYIRSKSMQKGRDSVIEGALRNGSSPEEISRVNGIPLEEILKVRDAMLEEA